MKARLAHLTGGRVGEAAIIWKSCAMLGRSPEADVRFGPDGDRMVAGRHASLSWHEGVWSVRDLGSANGTYVDGSRVHGETALRDGSIIQLGRDGPQVRFSIVWETGAPEPVRTVDVDAVGDPDALRPVPHIPVILSRPDHDEPLPPTSSGRPRRVAASLVLVIAALGGISLARAGPSDAPEALRLALLARADSVFAALEGIPGTAPGLRSAVSETQSRVALMRGRVRRAPADPVVLTTLRDSLGLLAARGRRLAGAAAIDVAAVVRGGAPAIGLVEMRLPDGRLQMAVAYAALGDEGRVRFVSSAPELLDASSAPTELRLFLRGDPLGIPLRITVRHRTRGVSILAPTSGQRTDVGAAAGRRAAFPAPGEPAILVDAAPATNRAVFVNARTALAAVVSVQHGVARLEQLGFDAVPGSAVFDRRGAMVGMVLPAAAGFGVRAVPVSTLLDPTDERAGG
ncbi:MAG: FHA domain-containing protein [Gemmatimonadales bacterium]